MNIRTQHLIPATAILLLAIVVCWISFAEEPASAYLFPRLIAVAMVFLATWNFIRAALGLAKVGTGFTKKMLLNVMPGVAVVIVFVFYFAKFLGFYVASTIAFVIIFAIYDPASHLEFSSWAKRILIAVIFMAVIYGLFYMLLKVQTPRGMFF